jgi:DNA-binding MarR family transcriptional regulator
MRVFERLRALRAFEVQHLLFLRTGGNHHLIVEIGYHQAKGEPLTLKQLFLLDFGSIATVQRDLRRLKELGLVETRRATSDRRAVELTLSLKCVRIFSKYGTLMGAKAPAWNDSQGGVEPRHVCAMCDSDAGGRKLLVTFLSDALKRGDKCVLVAPSEVQNEILAELPDRRKARRHLVVSEGYDSSDAQIAFYRRMSREAKQTGQNLCIAGPVTWLLARDIQIEAILNYEKRVDALARQLPFKALCVYDVRHISSGNLLRAVKCHRDHARHPVMLG